MYIVANSNCIRHNGYLHHVQICSFVLNQQSGHSAKVHCVCADISKEEQVKKNSL